MACVISSITIIYLDNLFDTDGLPKPFSRAPRLIVYKRELYDCAECINLCLLLRDRFSQLEATVETVVEGILKDWIKPDGSFRSRRLHLGWDNVPMHRWGQSQMFRSLAFYLCLAHRRTEDRGQKTADGANTAQRRRDEGRTTEDTERKAGRETSVKVTGGARVRRRSSVIRHPISDF